VRWGVAFGAIVLAVSLLVATVATADARRVVLIVADGLDARTVDAEHTPALDRLWREGAWCRRVIAEAAMPARTNVNHATLMTGVHPDVHGITGNAFWDRVSPAPRKLGAASDFLTETVFTVARGATPPLRTGAALGKGKLALMFAAAEGGPRVVWGPERAPAADRDSASGYATDRATLAGARELIVHGPLDFLLINLAEIDLTSHRFGPRAPEAWAARRATDALIRGFLDFLAARPEWDETTVVITADHGFDTITVPPLRFAEAAGTAGIEGIVAVGDGGVGHVYLRDRAGHDGDAVLERARLLARRTDGISDAFYVSPRPGGDAGITLGSVHPDWHLGHERSGDLLLIAEPGHVLVDGDGGEVRLLGNHGGPLDRQVPLIVVHGGSVRPGACGRPGAADVGRTIIAGCLGLRDVRRLDGQHTPAYGRGRVLPGLCPDSAPLSR